MNNSNEFELINIYVAIYAKLINMLAIIPISLSFKNSFALE